MKALQARKLNESYYRIDGDTELKKQLNEFLKIKKPNAQFDKMVQRGLASPFYYFCIIHDNQLIIPSGLKNFVKHLVQFEEDKELYSLPEISEFLNNIELPFDLYQHQINAITDSLNTGRLFAVSATGSGKSAVVSLIAEFMRLKNKKGLILVPSIDLVSQIHGDFLDYKLTDLYNNTHLIGGDNTDKHLNADITVTTWQSAMKMKHLMINIDYVIVDEGHRLNIDSQSADIVHQCLNAKLKIGLSGTLPEDPLTKMSLFSCTGTPKKYITTNGLVKLGLATPVKINVLHLRYNREDNSLFKHCKDYQQHLTFIKEHQLRNTFIAKLSKKVSKKTGTTVVMCSHVQHMKDIFTEIFKELYPDVVLENKNITGKKSFEFQEKYNIFYIAGATDSKNRKDTLSNLKEHNDAILVSNYAIFSTGLNIKSISNIVFASPMKSYTTISQSIGRAVRTHISKEVANIYDLVDDFSVRGGSGRFVKQYKHRLEKSYIPEEFPVVEHVVQLESYRS